MIGVCDLKDAVSVLRCKPYLKELCFCHRTAWGCYKVRRQQYLQAGLQSVSQCVTLPPCLNAVVSEK